MTDAQRDRAAELKAVVDSMFYAIKRASEEGGLVDVQEVEQWRANLSALAEAEPGEAVAWQRLDHFVIGPRFIVGRNKPSELGEWIPLYASPPLAPERAEDRRDAERYRWICGAYAPLVRRTLQGLMDRGWPKKDFDAAIDATMQADKEKGNG